MTNYPHIFVLVMIRGIACVLQYDWEIGSIASELIVCIIKEATNFSNIFRSHDQLGDKEAQFLANALSSATQLTELYLS